MLSRPLFFIACYFIAISKLYSQAAPLKAPVQFPSPEASNLGIVGTMPVSLHTGKLSVEIPISTGDVGRTRDMEDEEDRKKLDPDDFDKETVVNVTIKINIKRTEDLGITAESVLHEFAIHVLPYLKLIEQLRNGDLDGEKFKKEWERASAREGENNYNNGHQQHFQFAMGV
jgi:hypothetical protein